MNPLAKFSSEETPPKASAMINTFRAFGYNLPTAVADLIDNSISAGAKNIWLDYEWKGADSNVQIRDDGAGMDLKTLVNAMTPGSRDPNEERDKNDLGRFGLGLKTASFSQCKRLTVVSKKDNYQTIYRCWDLDFVNQTGRWTLLNYLSDHSVAEKLNGQVSGTVIFWENPDRLAGNAHPEDEAARRVFLEGFAEVEEHLRLVFHRYLEKNKLKIFINGLEITPWDPFMKEEDGRQLVGKELLENGNVEVRCYVMPHLSKLTIEKRKAAKTEDWYKLQGFYIYRNERLLLHGSWLGLFPKNEHYKNARILIDIPNHLDHLWQIDIKKATATPSVSIRKDLQRLGQLTRLAAGKMYRYRGNQLRLSDTGGSFNYQSVWKATQKRDGSVHYYLNKKHPLIAEVLNENSVSIERIKAMLKLIGETTPVEAIIQNYSEKPESLELRGQEKELDEGTLQVAKRLFESFKKNGLNREAAVKQIFSIQPFDDYPQLIEYLK